MVSQAPRILVLSGSAGHGHVMAGEAVEAALRIHPAAVHVEHWDGVEKMSRIYGRVYKRGYIALVDRHPLVWRWLYESTDRRLSATTRAITRWAGRDLVQRIRAWRPDAIVCTHFLALEVLDGPARHGLVAAPIHAVVTDHDIHRTWVWPSIATWHVASDAVAARLALRYGIDRRRIDVSGIPIRPQFLEVGDETETRRRFGLAADRPVVLFLSGGFVAGDLPRAVQGLWLEHREAQAIVVAGRNEKLRRKVDRIPRPSGAVLHALGFVRDVASLMRVADVVVAKSGGITVSECTGVGRPLVISGSIAGQEERNADALVEAGAAVRAPTVEEIRWHLGRLLDSEPTRAAMAARARAFGRPEAAQHIAERLLAPYAADVGPAGPWFHGAR